ncbi:MAG: acyltransferase [Chloroherpetonaceae bacterium]|nr:acyltransferase [Chloroherpetonaceae bacterium]
MQKGSRVKTIDGLRGLAILIVTIYHCLDIVRTNTVIFSYLKNSIWSFGGGGNFALVLTGFLITKVLHSLKGKNDYYRTFFINRSLRLIPLFYFFILIFFNVVPLVFKEKLQFQYLWNNQIWHWFFVHNWSPLFVDYSSGNKYISHLWFIGVEQQVFIFFPLLYLYLNDDKFIKLSIFLIVLTPILRFLLLLTADNSVLMIKYIHYMTITRLDSVFWGALLFKLILDKERLLYFLSHLKKSLLFTVFILLSLSFLLFDIPTLSKVEDFPLLLIPNSIGYTIGSFLSILIIGWGWTVSEESKFGRYLSENRLLQGVGTYAYSIYLFHFPFIHLIKEIWFFFPVSKIGGAVNQLLFISIVFALSYLFALITWKLIEKPFMDLKELNFFKKKENSIIA